MKIISAFALVVALASAADEIAEIPRELQDVSITDYTATCYGGAEPCDTFSTKSAIDSLTSPDDFIATFKYPSVGSGTKVTCTATCTTSGTARIYGVVGTLSGIISGSAVGVNDAGCPVTVEFTASSEGDVYAAASGALLGTNGLSEGKMTCNTGAAGEPQSLWGRVQSIFNDGARRLRGGSD